MQNLENFLQHYTPYKSYREAPKSLIKKFKGALPQILLDLWEKHGFASYKQGWLWTVNPTEFEHLKKDFPDLFLPHHHVIGRFSFGHLLVWGDDGQTYRCLGNGSAL